MNNFIFLRSGKVIGVDAEHRDQVKADIAKRADFWYKGTLVKYLEIKDSSIGAPDPVADEVPRIPEGERRESFWAKVLEINHARQKDGRKWLFAGTVERARRNSLRQNPSDLFSLVDENWDEFREGNVPSLAGNDYHMQVCEMTHRALIQGKVTQQDIIMAR